MNNIDNIKFYKAFDTYFNKEVLVVRLITNDSIVKEYHIPLAHNTYALLKLHTTITWSNKYIFIDKTITSIDNAYDYALTLIYSYIKESK